MAGAASSGLCFIALRCFPALLRQTLLSSKSPEKQAFPHIPINANAWANLLKYPRGGGSGLPPRAPPALCPPITNLECGAGGDADGEGQLSELAARPHEGHLGIPSRGRRASSLPQSPGGRKERGEERAEGEKEHKRARGIEIAGCRDAVRAFLDAGADTSE